jgi:hypothetical protein
MSHPSERRRHTRHEVHDLTGHLRGDDRAQVLDLSVNGLAIETDAWLKVGETYTIRVHAGADQMDVAGLVSWCRLVAMAPRDSGERRPRYRAGIEFGDALSEKARQILDFARKSGLVSSPDRIFARFVPSQKALDVAVDHPCEILRASAGGMLIRCSRRPEIGERLEIRFPAPEGQLATTVEVRDVQQHSAEDAAAPPSYDIGVAFVEMTLGQRARLDQLLKQPPRE